MKIKKEAGMRDETLKNEAFVILKADSISARMPEFEDNDVMPDYALLATALVLRLHKDETFAQEVMEWFYNTVDNMEESNND